MGPELPRVSLKEFMAFRVSYFLDDFPPSDKNDPNIGTTMIDTTYMVYTARTRVLLVAQAKKVDEEYAENLDKYFLTKIKNARLNKRSIFTNKKALEKSLVAELQPEVTCRLVTKRLMPYTDNPVFANFCQQMVCDFIQERKNKERGQRIGPRI